MSGTHFISRDKCPSCATDNFRSIFERPYDHPVIKEYLRTFYSPQGVEFEVLEGATYFLCECNGCGLIFQKEIPDVSLMERLYEKWIDPHKVFMQSQVQDGLEYYSNQAQEIMQVIAYLGEVPSSLSFFDFGMGWGKWALMAKAFGCDSYGSELSEDRIEYAKSSGIKIISWDEIPQHKFDFINTEQVFEHIPEPLQTLCHLKRALKPNGILKISVPHANDIERRLKIMDWTSPKGTKNSLNPVAPLEHINFFRRKSIIKMSSAAGMEEVFIPMKQQYRYSTDWSGIKGIAKNILRPIFRNILKRRNYLFFRNAC